MTHDPNDPHRANAPQHNTTNVTTSGGPNVMIIAIVAIVVLVLVWFLFLRGDSTPTVTDTPPAATETAPATSNDVTIDVTPVEPAPATDPAPAADPAPATETAPTTSN